MDFIFKTFIKDPKDTCYDGEDRDERILYVIRKSWIIIFRWMIIFVLMLVAPQFIFPIIFDSFGGASNFFSPQFLFITNVFWYLVSLGFFLQNFMNWYFSVNVITNKKIIDVDFKGLLYKNISEAPLDNIEDVTSNISGTLKVIFNYGNILIQTAAEKTEFEFEDIDNPSKVRDIISDLIAELDKNRKDK